MRVQAFIFKAECGRRTVMRMPRLGARKGKTGRTQTICEHDIPKQALGSESRRRVATPFVGLCVDDTVDGARGRKFRLAISGKSAAKAAQCASLSQARGRRKSDVVSRRGARFIPRVRCAYPKLKISRLLARPLEAKCRMTILKAHGLNTSARELPDTNFGPPVRRGIAAGKHPGRLRARETGMPNTIIFASRSAAGAMSCTSSTLSASARQKNCGGPHNEV